MAMEPRFETLLEPRIRIRKALQIFQLPDDVVREREAARAFLLADRRVALRALERSHTLLLSRNRELFNPTLTNGVTS